MRNPNRIEPFMDELGKIWKEECPDWRFGQLIFNVIGHNGMAFYMEEDKMLEAVKKYFKREDQDG